MTIFVQVVVNVPAVSGIFDYAIAESLLGQTGIKTPCFLQGALIYAS
jgi:hypothetical protein